MSAIALTFSVRFLKMGKEPVDSFSVMAEGANPFLGVFAHFTSPLLLLLPHYQTCSHEKLDSIALYARFGRYGQTMVTVNFASMCHS